MQARNDVGQLCSSPICGSPLPLRELLKVPVGEYANNLWQTVWDRLKIGLVLSPVPLAGGFELLRKGARLDKRARQRSAGARPYEGNGVLGRGRSLPHEADVPRGEVEEEYCVGYLREGRCEEPGKIGDILTGSAKTMESVESGRASKTLSREVSYHNRLHQEPPPEHSAFPCGRIIAAPIGLVHLGVLISVSHTRGGGDSPCPRFHRHGSCLIHLLNKHLTTQIHNGALLFPDLSSILSFCLWSRRRPSSGDGQDQGMRTARCGLRHFETASFLKKGTSRALQRSSVLC